MNGDAVSFGPFRLLAAQRLLLEGDKPVRLGSRAFDILAALVERAGQVVGKDELIARVWPKTFVEETNLKIQVSALRRALGDGQVGHRYVVTVPGRGYNFVAPIDVEESSPPPLAATFAPRASHNLPTAVTRMIGREEAVAAIILRLSEQRLVTVVGPGGIGKTTVALAVAERLIAGYEDGVWLVDLAPLGDPRLVASAVAIMLGVEIHTEDPLSCLVSALRDKRMLLLLDNCEHVIESAASLVTVVLGGGSGVDILATSREPLRVSGEHEYRLRPLSGPRRSSELSAAEAGAFPAVRLFVERVSAVVEDFALSDANAPLVGQICRRLDGLPLAIEFAAPSVEVLGVEGLAAHLDHSLPGLVGRHRTAFLRHRTMRAVLDWSFGLLTEDERQFLRALGIFAGGFTIEAATAVTGNAANTRDAIDRLADLVAKSLVVADVNGADPRFRLLDTTRAYALEKLGESGEHERIARQHAEYYRDLFVRAETEWDRRTTAEWLADYGHQLDDLRAALVWAFSPTGNTSVGVALTVAAVPLWFQLSLVDECLGWAERALAHLEMAPAPDERRRMQLYAALGWLQMYATARLESSTAAWRTALRLAEELEDTDYQLRALWALWADHTNHAEFREALTLAAQFRSLSARAGNIADQLVGDRMTGASLHFLGNQTGARECIERMLGRYTTPAHRSHVVRFQFDQRVTARITLARVFWIQGLADQALREANSNIEHAVSINHTLSLCNALAQGACPIALLVGDYVMAERYTAMLRRHTGKNTLDVWRAYADCFDGERLIRCGNLDTGLSLLRPAVDELWRTGFVQYHTAFVVALALGLLHAGGVAEALVSIDAALQRCERTGEGWARAELLRVRGELLQREGAPGAAFAAQGHYQQSLDCARSQGALSWELRAAISLARLLRDQDRSRDATALLQPVYDRFTEGFDAADLVAARQLLYELSEAGRR
jgi:predicted ATPase